MKALTILIVFAVSAFAESSVRSFTAEELVNLALSDNPELRFYEQQGTALPKPSDTRSPVIPQPLDFPSRENFRRAVLNLDAELARFYLAEFRFALASPLESDGVPGRDGDERHCQRPCFTHLDARKDA